MVAPWCHHRPMWPVGLMSNLNIHLHCLMLDGV